MAHCNRAGVVYRRHKFKNGVCKCGIHQVKHLRAVANRREKRKHNRLVAAQKVLSAAGVAQV